MRLSPLIVSALIYAATATPASADVTLRLKGSGQMFDGPVAEDLTVYRKGLKVRTDSTSNGVSLTTIIDLDTDRSILLWHHSKTAEVIDRSQIAELISRDRVPAVRPTITPTTQTRHIAGSTCLVYHIKGTYPGPKLDMVPPTMVSEGTVCLVKNGPGQADFTAFYQAGGKSDEPFDPSLGVPFAMEMTIGFRGDEPTSPLMDAGTFRTEVISVSTAPIPDSMFEIPVDYKIIKR